MVYKQHHVILTYNRAQLIQCNLFSLSIESMTQINTMKENIFFCYSITMWGLALVVFG